MRLFAFYLPQFHRIKENDMWWGEGFTEWTNVKAAKPCYKGHEQPVIPLDNNYYNLLDKKTVQWQTELMKKYSVDGLIYYHYYFCGRKLLEKPVENLLRWKDIDQPFFFCWANHSWRRTWDGKQELLVEQKYGNRLDWEEHFKYLLPFFVDERYEKINNKPIFMLFKSDFDEKEEMIEYFNDRCIESGFDGIYIIETIHNLKKSSATNISKSTDGTSFYREPTVSQFLYLYKHNYPLELLKWKTKRAASKLNIHLPIIRYDGDELYRLMMSSEYDFSSNIPGLFFSWDNTPRHHNNGYVITPPSKELFFEYMKHISNCEYVFINAWNEWAEGMTLEPTEHLKYQYLEWISEWNNNSRNNRN